MDIYERLKKDHETQKSLAGQIMETSGDSEQRRRLWDEFRKEAEAHAAAEEQTFYATLIGKPEGQKKARHSVHEHKKAADLLEELRKLDMGSGGWLQKFGKLKRELEHHIEEEEKKIFAKARRLIDAGKAEKLADSFNTRKAAELKQL